MMPNVTGAHLSPGRYGRKPERHSAPNWAGGVGSAFDRFRAPLPSPDLLSSSFHVPSAALRMTYLSAKPLDVPACHSSLPCEFASMFTVAFNVTSDVVGAFGDGSMVTSTTRSA